MADWLALSHVTASSEPYGPGVTAWTGPKALRSQLLLSSPACNGTPPCETNQGQQQPSGLQGDHLRLIPGAQVPALGSCLSLQSQQSHLQSHR